MFTLQVARGLLVSVMSALQGPEQPTAPLPLMNAVLAAADTYINLQGLTAASGSAIAPQPMPN